jgi:hypothetical protein
MLRWRTLYARLKVFKRSRMHSFKTIDVLNKFSSFVCCCTPMAPRSLKKLDFPIYCCTAVHFSYLYYTWSPILFQFTYQCCWVTGTYVAMCVVNYRYAAWYWLTDYVGWDWRLRTATITGLLFISRVNVSGELWWYWCRLGITPDLTTIARWQSYQQRHLERVESTSEGMRNLRIQYLW